MKNEKRYRLVPFSIIEAAARGEILAVEAVLDHYSGYIAMLSTQTYFDAYGNVKFYVDEVIRQRVKVKPITKILDFRTERE